MENWKDVEGYEGLYVVSSKGRVRGSRGFILMPSKNDRGYERVTLCKNNQRKTLKLSRLVARAFIDNPEGKTEVNHKSGVKSDNCVNNLEWSTHAENMQHAYDTGLKKPMENEKHPMCKFSDDVVAYIRSHIAGGATRREMQELFGISKKQIWSIVHNISRKI